MGRLIRFELRKILKSRYLYVTAAISVLFIIILGATSSIAKAIVEGQGQVYEGTAYSFAKSALGGTFTMLIGVFVAIAATEDNAMGTTKNIIARGYSRIKIFLAKYITSFIGVLLISAISLIVATIYGNIAFPHGEITDNLVAVIFGQLFGLLAYHALFYAISSGFGKIGPAIAVSLIGPMGVTLILTLVDTAIRIEDAKLSKYWVSSLFGNFTGTTDPTIYGRCFGLLAAYFVVSLFIGFLISRNKEY